MAHELGQAKLHVDVANDNVKASEAHAQLLLVEAGAAFKGADQRVAQGT
jgi:hypothetical protein